MAEIKLEHIYKRYPGNDEDSVTDFNLDIKDNEFIVFGWSFQVVVNQQHYV
ncbi:hypothetical protein S101258_00677 [Lactiplantibacillus plantarum subsp. plantarum]|uniref:Uncharacterized protein n=1 Tax=Lactiplantibacillus plantarum subsp. plantarum TaxID=337330 RepID=A0A2S3U8C9_LACPN|nr:hypothetical protein S101258_00677 [Lactiplantibacillus plantarum subsp. plantarum]